MECTGQKDGLEAVFCCLPLHVDEVRLHLLQVLQLSLLRLSLGLALFVREEAASDADASDACNFGCSAKKDTRKILEISAYDPTLIHLCDISLSLSDTRNVPLSFLVFISFVSNREQSAT